MKKSNSTGPRTPEGKQRSSLDTVQCEDGIHSTDDRAVTAGASARAFEMHVKMLATLSLYGQRIARHLHRRPRRPITIC